MWLFSLLLSQIYHSYPACNLHMCMWAVYLLDVSELFLAFCVPLCWPEHNDQSQYTDRGISNSSAMAASLYNHPCYCLNWFIERQRPLVPLSRLPGLDPNACIVFHFSAIYCHGETLQPWARVPVSATDVSACAVNKDQLVRLLAEKISEIR